MRSHESFELLVELFKRDEGDVK